jgi:hypothetical protein
VTPSAPYVNDEHHQLQPGEQVYAAGPTSGTGLRQSMLLCQEHCRSQQHGDGDVQPAAFVDVRVLEYSEFIR